MSQRNEKELRVNGLTEFFNGLTGLARENYLSSFKFGLSFWEESMRTATNAQISQFFGIQKVYAEQAKNVFERFTEQTARFWSGIFSKAFDGNFDHLTSIQRYYINLIKGASEKFTKEAVSLTEKTAEKAFSVSEGRLKRTKSAR